MELIHYFDHRFNKPSLPTINTLPFVTISRETGCDAVKITKLLIKKLKSRGQNWKYVDKEILNASAKKLKLDKSKIEYVFDVAEKTHADEILSALSSRYYKSDKMVKNAITDVVKHMAGEGNVVLVGRGGAAITSKMKLGTHIRLAAPLKWRIDSLMSRKNNSEEEISSFIINTDKKRKRLLEVFSEDKSKDIPFDVVINCARFSQKQIVDIIINIMDQRNSI
ncbi:MAG: cytidylate kinase-like family protein [Bacteroidetes bacterium]|nr:cytidylate kinase-like family protein [Bacteroidota bacterium]